VKATHIANVNEIYVRWDGASVTCDLSELNTIQLPLKEEPTLHDYCVVYYEGDDLNNVGWYRGQIIEEHFNELSDSTFSVRLIDLGVEEFFSPENIYEMPRKYFYQRRLCVRFGVLRHMPVADTRVVNASRHYLEQLFGLHDIAIFVEEWVRRGYSLDVVWCNKQCKAHSVCAFGFLGAKNGYQLHTILGRNS
jgi:hypothetical protein